MEGMEGMEGMGDMDHSPEHIHLNMEIDSITSTMDSASLPTLTGHYHAAPTSTSKSETWSKPPEEHHHHAAGYIPKTELDEAEILERHGPIPLSFLYHDFVLTPSQTWEFRQTGLSPEGNATMEMSRLNSSELQAWQQSRYDTHDPRSGSREGATVMSGDGKPHPYLILAHAGFMSIAFFIALPLVLSFKAAAAIVEGGRYISPRMKVGGWVEIAANATYWISFALGWLSGVWYKQVSPNL